MSKIGLDKSPALRYYTLADCEAACMEKSRSWPSAHDWKSCIPQKGIEGSNPSFSAKKESHPKGWLFFFGGKGKGFEKYKCSAAERCPLRLDAAEP